ncbi:hypothetical protein AVEN_18803-1 [Araneus ventricosus]|uniref:Uncharacterized protein n=1 Tax=Araneus ventricosus TaxID=182803 RepID=A0A4Y2S735_ARAVE|nr:hypothetical protein AVEN_16573-1 [Araneus ventricosus]GBN83692.1 hypothetical protein AVEN_18803-1 [Araneus ventricosus]
MRLPPVPSARNEIQPVLSPLKCSGISCFHNDRHRYVWCLVFFLWRQASTEAEVLVAITRQGPRRRCVLSLEGVSLPPPLLYPQKKRESAYLSAGFPSTYS